jgi:hypothetical protein
MSIRSRFRSAKVLVPPELPGGPSRDGQQLSSLETGPYILSIENNRKGCAVQHQNAPNDTFAIKQLAESTPGIAQTPTAFHVDADIEAIRELQERIEHLWGNLAAPSREDLSARLDLLGTAADHRATDSRSVREALQQVLLTIGTGALAALSEPTRQRLAALTGIALPGHLPVAGWRSAAEGPEDRGSAPDSDQLAGLPAAADKGAGN